MNWKMIEEKFNEEDLNTTRAKDIIRERWSRKIKSNLLDQFCEGPEEVKQYKVELIEHIIKLEISDKRQIKWKEVGNRFPNKTTQQLNQDFHGLIKYFLQQGLSFQESLERAHTTQLRKQQKQKVTSTQVKQENDKMKLRDFYDSLIK